MSKASKDVYALVKTERQRLANVILEKRRIIASASRELNDAQTKMAELGGDPWFYLRDGE
jgi:hypothetical protein